MHNVYLAHGTFGHDGHTFRLTTEPDTEAGLPWEEAGSHGHVSEWRHSYNPKAPGEVVLCQDHTGAYRAYNMRDAIAKAQQERWGYGGKSVEEWLAAGLTIRQVATKAAEDDYRRLSDWCDDTWEYTGVCVELLDDDGEGTGETDTLWGVESDDTLHIADVATECADNILANLRDRAK